MTPFGPSAGKLNARARPEVVDGPPKRMYDDVVRGLSAAPKSLSSKYFYDEVGSRLFDEITELEEYYPTRAETRIMERFAADMAHEMGSGTLLVELGSGSSAKTRVLLDHLDAPAGYIPVDISGHYLAEVATRLRAEHEGLTVLPLVADFTEPLALPSTVAPPARRIAYFPLSATSGSWRRADSCDVCAPSWGRMGAS